MSDTFTDRLDALEKEVARLSGRLRWGVLRYPLGSTCFVEGDGTEVTISNEDIARQIVDAYEKGGVMLLPNARDPQTGGYLWEWQPNDLDAAQADRANIVEIRPR